MFIAILDVRTAAADRPAALAGFDEQGDRVRAMPGNIAFRVYAVRADDRGLERRWPTDRRDAPAGKAPRRASGPSVRRTGVAGVGQPARFAELIRWARRGDDQPVGDRLEEERARGRDHMLAGAPADRRPCSDSQRLVAAWSLRILTHVLR